MRLYLDRRIELLGSAGVAEIITEARSWTRGWVARLVNGQRRWVEHSDAVLSRAGYGRRYFIIAEEGAYEADSACASLRAHRVRFDIESGGVIVLRTSRDPRRCGHLRALDRKSAQRRQGASASPMEFLRSVSAAQEPWEAAVLLGGYLEQHLRRMCEDRGLDVGPEGWSRGITGLSTILKKAGVFPKEHHKQVLRLADLRKHAQHRGSHIQADEIMDATKILHRLLTEYPASMPVEQ